MEKVVLKDKKSPFFNQIPFQRQVIIFNGLYNTAISSYLSKYMEKVVLKDKKSPFFGLWIHSKP